MAVHTLFPVEHIKSMRNWFDRKKKLTISFGVITATAGKVEVVVAVVADVVVTTNEKTSVLFNSLLKDYCGCKRIIKNFVLAETITCGCNEGSSRGCCNGSSW